MIVFGTGTFTPSEGLPEGLHADTELKVIAIEGGGDWVAASVEYLVIPKSADLTTLAAECLALPYEQRQSQPLSKRLIEEHDAQGATEPYIEVISEDL